jgi:hypothetical protein
MVLLNFFFASGVPHTIEIIHLEVAKWVFSEEKSAKSFQLLLYPKTGFIVVQLGMCRVTRLRYEKVAQTIFVKIKHNLIMENSSPKL